MNIDEKIVKKILFFIYGGYLRFDCNEIYMILKSIEYFGLSNDLVLDIFNYLTKNFLSLKFITSQEFFYGFEVFCKYILDKGGFN